MIARSASPFRSASFSFYNEQASQLSQRRDERGCVRGVVERRHLAEAYLRSFAAEVQCLATISQGLFDGPGISRDVGRDEGFHLGSGFARLFVALDQVDSLCIEECGVIGLEVLAGDGR